MSKKKIKPKVLWSLNQHHEEFDGPCDNVLFEIRPDDSYFKVFYYGACAIHSSLSIEEAKKYVFEYINRGKK